MEGQAMIARGKMARMRQKEGDQDNYVGGSPIYLILHDLTPKFNVAIFDMKGLEPFCYYIKDGDWRYAEGQKSRQILFWWEAMR